MYGSYAPSKAQKHLLTAMHFVALVLAAWLIFGFGENWRGQGEARRFLMLACLFIYFVRLRLTTYVFIKRTMEWGEVVIISFWILIFSVFYAAPVRHSSWSFDWVDAVGIFLFVAGSFLNSYSEYQRMKWKNRPENKGHLYQAGLFRYSRHINYFGDVVSFTGISIISRSWFTAWIPVAMLLGFVIVNVPMLDKYLAEKYALEWPEYASRTKRFVPFVY